MANCVSENQLTSFANSIDFAQPLRFILFRPPLEELFEHS